MAWTNDEYCRLVAGGMGDKNLKPREERLSIVKNEEG
jgi:hypothetical protein